MSGVRDVGGCAPWQGVAWRGGALLALVLVGVGCRQEPPRPVVTVERTPAATPVAVEPPLSEPYPPDTVLAPDRRDFPGITPTPYLYYRDAAASHVAICGVWDRWHQRSALTQHQGLWVFDVRPLGLKPGRYEYKFLVNGEWEPGANRQLVVGEQHWLERPPALVLDARIAGRDRVVVTLTQALAPSTTNLAVALDPGVPIRSVSVRPGRDRRALAGFLVSGDSVVFSFDDRVFRAGLSSNDTVCVAGTFNGWNPSAWRLDWVSPGLWEKRFEGVEAGAGRPEGRFKFVINGTRWIEPRRDAPNVAIDEQGNTNFRLGAEYSHGGALEIITAVPLALSNTWSVAISNLAAQVIRYPVRPGAVLDLLQTTAPLGLALGAPAGRARLSLFAPRATRCWLWASARPSSIMRWDGETRAEVSMQCNASDGTWTGEWDDVDRMPYYGCRLDGPGGTGESFDGASFVGDPYARAVVSEVGPCIALDPLETNAWFRGWTDAGYRPPAPQDMVIYETHVRDLTADPSSGVPPALRGTFRGVLATWNTGVGLDHIQTLGVNMIEFMPVQEFDNSVTNYGWGYSPEYYFAPESSYGTAPALGSQYYEFKALVNELHGRGLGVILDVVFNHVGGVNVLGRIDRRVYFRLDSEDGYRNDSGCGNDLRSESPALRRLIVDNIVYWIREHHVDGFRFDLAELVDMDTLRAVEAAARAANPNVILISEPWSSRGDHKRALKGSSWAAWNNEFTHPVRGFCAGMGRPDEVPKAIAGSVDLWTASPLQSINYLESHDDMTLADELSSAIGRDGRRLNEVDAARNRLGATVLLTSLGIPMLCEGQEFLRSKHGIRNTFDRGDAINDINWSDRDRPLAREALAYYRGLVHLRQSPEGASLRLSEAAPAGYIDWILPASGQLLGYRINARHQKSGRAFVVLLNAGNHDAGFEVDLSAGRWRLVGDGRSVDLTGQRVKPLVVQGGTSARITVPALTAYIFMEGP